MEMNDLARRQNLKDLAEAKRVELRDIPSKCRLSEPMTRLFKHFVGVDTDEVSLGQAAAKSGYPNSMARKRLDDIAISIRHL